jgi:hypothetical protein
MNDSYQAMSGTRRRMMTINGEPVAEIDIRASYLTIFLSMHGVQLDATKDPYELQGFGEEHRSRKELVHRDLREQQADPQVATGDAQGRASA